ncbi:hypothetical protein P3T25_003762 [Paraburkholderia sp. GAS32]
MDCKTMTVCEAWEHALHEPLSGDAHTHDEIQSPRRASLVAAFGGAT